MVVVPHGKERQSPRCSTARNYFGTTVPCNPADGTSPTRMIHRINKNIPDCHRFAERLCAALHVRIWGRAKLPQSQSSSRANPPPTHNKYSTAPRTIVPQPSFSRETPTKKVRPRLMLLAIKRTNNTHLSVLSAQRYYDASPSSLSSSMP